MASSPIIYAVYPPQASVRGRGRLKLQLLTWLPVLAFSLLFAVESTSYLGREYTDAPLRRMAEWLCGNGVDEHWFLIHTLIRKTGHFLGYGLFSLVCFRGFWITFRSVASRLLRRLSAHGLAILATFLVASADEFHQCFVPNRYGQFSDVLLDTAGAVALGAVLFLVMTALEASKTEWNADLPVGCRVDLLVHD
jgi:VanZ family protein